MQGFITVEVRDGANLYVDVTKWGTQGWIAESLQPLRDISFVADASRYNDVMSMCGGPPGASSQPVGNESGRKVFCVKFQKELPGLDSPPWPGEVGERIYQQVSADAWKLWEERQKMILNEYRLMPWQKEAQEVILKHMEDFFFGEGAALPPGYVPQQSKG